MSKKKLLPYQIQERYLKIKKMDENLEVDYKSPKIKVISIVLIIIVSIAGTYFITKNITEGQNQKAILNVIVSAYNQCQQICDNKKPAFTNFNGETMDCICLDFANGNSTNNIIQG